MGEKQKARIEELQNENAELRTQLENAKKAIRFIRRQIAAPPSGGLRQFLEGVSDVVRSED